jgi:hypothetical protein
VVVLAKLVSYGGGRPPIAQVAGDLALSPSQVHASLKRLERSRLIDAQMGRPLLKAVEEFLIHGVKYAFPVQRGQTTRGMPTAHAAPPLSDQIAENGDLPPVWPDAEGQVRGVTLEPLHKAVPKAARKDPVLHELLALLDALRDGRARAAACGERVERTPSETSPWLIRIARSSSRSFACSQRADIASGNVAPGASSSVPATRWREPLFFGLTFSTNWAEAGELLSV